MRRFVGAGMYRGYTGTCKMCNCVICARVQQRASVPACVEMEERAMCKNVQACNDDPMHGPVRACPGSRHTDQSRDCGADLPHLIHLFEVISEQKSSNSAIRTLTTGELVLYVSDSDSCTARLAIASPQYLLRQCSQNQHLVAHAKWANQIERGQYLSVDGSSWQQRPAQSCGSCDGYMVGLMGLSAFHKLYAPKENPCEHELYTAAELEFDLQSSARPMLTNSCRLTVHASSTPSYPHYLTSSTLT